MRTSALLAFLPFMGPVQAAVLPAAEIDALVGDVPAELIDQDTQRAGSTESQLSLACKAAGNVGEIAGPPFFTRLRSGLGTAAINVQGVAYAATGAGYYAGGDPAGSATMASLINQAATKCPSTKIVIGGYSQGAQLVHKAANTLTAAVTATIAALVVFGDPNRGQAVGTVPNSKVLSICHALDIIYTGFGGWTTHLNYYLDASPAAEYISAHV